MRPVGDSDTLIGGSNAYLNILYGDAYQFHNGGAGGADIIIGGENAGSNALYGDAYTLIGGAGGNDTLVGGKWAIGGNVLFGDADNLENSTGGSDTLVGGEYTHNEMYGDAFSISGGSGGDDRLISGVGSNDWLWGDAPIMLNGAIGGSDTFAFAGHFGSDFIRDFRNPDGDCLEIDIESPATPNEEVTWEASGPNVVITVIGSVSSGTITLLNYGGTLTLNDFVFV